MLLWCTGGNTEVSTNTEQEYIWSVKPVSSDINDGALVHSTEGGLFLLTPNNTNYLSIDKDK